MGNSTLSFSPDGLKQLKRDESVIDGLYDDPSMYCTFGVGHLVHSSDKWECFLLEAASSDEEWKSMVLKQWPGKSYETPYLIRGAVFKEKFDKLKEIAVEKAKAAVAQRKYNKTFDKLSAAEQQSATSAAKAAIDEQARILAKAVDDVLKEDLIPFEKAVRDGVSGVNLSQDEFDALVSLTFNIGVTNFNISTLLKEVNKNKFRAGDLKERKARHRLSAGGRGGALGHLRGGCGAVQSGVARDRGGIGNRAAREPRRRALRLGLWLSHHCERQ